MSPGGRSADYVVVGAGSSGAVVASRLSADPSRTVVLLEAGDQDTRPELRRTDAASVIGLLTSDWSPRIDWGYATEAEPGLDGRVVPVARGKVLGGSSSVNALMWVRGHRDDYDRWSREGNTGWSFDEVLPYFRRAENYAQAPTGSVDRGTRGPVRVRDLDDPSPVARSFVAATRELGFGAGAGASSGTEGFDYNGAQQEGGGFFYQTTRTPDNERSSTASAYLAPVADRPNLRVEVRAQVTRLLFTGVRVTGVEYVQDGVRHTVGVEQEAIVSAGAFESPKLLMLSGVGPAAHLREHGLPVVRDLPGVGENLQDHPFVPLCHQALHEHPAGALLSEAGMFTHTAAGAAAAGFTGAAEPGRPTSPDLQFTFGPIKFLPPTASAELWEGPGFTFAPILLHPASRGSVRLRGADPADTAVVRANYLQRQVDVEVLAEGLTLARELAARTAFDGIRGPELAPGKAVTGRKELRAFIRANTSTLWHPVGTCRMGDDPMAVVDAELRVHGIDGLRIADASIMPHIVSGNTNAACVMIGEKAADLIAHTPSPPTTGRTS
ncbi:GMC family oxidoreductase [Streptomyces montanisoli]|uniref:GMC family oxidoreductase N-terminal domain-containing protein n=1 Tax=Streptomyces montanisoli TaxID=2798581 RepID=A0A940MA59_9ACTN|nr:GMC family oxidoreductase N-terminal domain-containing protein [Streptomyces montanisoli]MBP0456305.1 GMC family oxidoreductase N-terminal domain-containing protein [Streptomyces montanisoli]